METKQISPLYDCHYEHDNCGIGAVVNIKGVKSHQNVDDALSIVERLEHRAGMDAERKTGDGVGILTQIPHDYFRKHLKLKLPESKFAVGMFFFPNQPLEYEKAKKLFEVLSKKEKLNLVGWREVEKHDAVLGHKALECMPKITQCFIARPDGIENDLAFDRRLYILRKEFEKSNLSTYVCSLSCRTIVYKGMFLVKQLRTFYADLQHEDYISAISMVHSRFSTNTMPSWERAHPNRLIVHNGEINTIKGNSSKMYSREENFKSDILSDKDMDKVLPVIDARGSDSAMLDNSLEFLMMAGMPLPRAVMMSIPEPFQNDNNINKLKHDFYQYSACLMEPWDGPASILFSDGDIMGAVLDRNGLRPSRYYITNDDNLVLSSEVGVLPFKPEDIKVKERLKPGKMLLIDTIKGQLISDEELKQHEALTNPYGEWLASNLVELKSLTIPNHKTVRYLGKELAQLQKVFGYAYEDIKDYVLPTALSGKEPIIAMGNDTPLAVLDKRPQPLFNYFKQLFAQVTNPPIDAIREEIITASDIYLGADGNILKDDPLNCRLLKIHNPILSNLDVLKIRNMHISGFKVETISMLYYKNTSLEKAIDNLFYEADKAYHNGCTILILSDRGIDENHLAIPSLLATSALNQYFVKTKKRLRMALIIESGEPREVHHFATLLGYGASAVNPYLVHDTIQELIDKQLLDKDYYAAISDYDLAMLHGITKIASKMGISTIQSYQGSKNFEAIGISKNVILKYFDNTVSRIEGINLHDIQKQQAKLHAATFDELGLNTNDELDSFGAHKYRSNCEEHLYNPKTIHLLQKSTRKADYQLYKEYAQEIEKEMGHTTLRGLLDFNYQNKPIDINEVESVDSIVTRFKTGAMSYGSISKEAHECMAIAMNRLKGKSNSGEGGEDAERFKPLSNNDSLCSAIKQVASGRFGVTSEYLCSAQEIQIKMAQGAKPGEGGQLPAGKVYPWIASTRHSTPGVSLISPPPHHDIYSIEDLAQLIYDLKNANDLARISVKLVSEAGVGTIAAGVAKAGSEVILISGYDGGTGAAPRNSVYHAGLPWELGLAETHQTLIMNGLRERVRIETDGKLMSGRDVAIACLLGAEEFGFATAPLVTMGCVMMRVCNLDTCPVGVATQNPALRKYFSGKPEYVENFMRFTAQQLREIMASLGIKKLDDMVGRSDYLKLKDNLNSHYKKRISLQNILDNPFAKEKHIFDRNAKYDFELSKTIDEKLINTLKDDIAKGNKKTINVEVDNLNRTFATRLGSYVTTHNPNLKPETIILNVKGSGGQSFGAFLPKGISINLSGDANDYFAKGLSGGIISLKVPDASTFVPEKNIIVGNVALYGATSGEVYISGVAGERFAVRNSGASAVVEGVGDHGLEYMTGGEVLIIGNCGRNIAAGMSGGFAYILDEDNQLYEKVNREMVNLITVSEDYDLLEIKRLLNQHIDKTGSQKATKIMKHFDEYQNKFKKIMPYDYEQMIKLINKYETKGLSKAQAQIEAFYEKKGGKVNNG